jgi:hypothetical protein
MSKFKKNMKKWNAATILLNIYLVFSIVHGCDYILYASGGGFLHGNRPVEYIVEGIFFIIFSIAIMAKQRWGFYGFIAAHITIMLRMIFVDNLSSLIHLYLISLIILIILNDIVNNQSGLLKKLDHIYDKVRPR